MKYIKGVLFSLILGYIYFILTIAAIGIVAATDIAAVGKIFWWFDWQDNFHFHHIALNFIGIGIASLIPAYLVHSYEQDIKWIVILVVVLSSMLFQGNVNYIFIDPNGLVRFFKSIILYGDIGSFGILLEMILLPILWLYVLKPKTRK